MRIAGSQGPDRLIFVVQKVGKTVGQAVDLRFDLVHKIACAVAFALLYRSVGWVGGDVGRSEKCILFGCEGLIDALRQILEEHHGRSSSQGGAQC